MMVFQKSMTSLIACLSTGKGTWVEVISLIKCHEWDKVLIITNDFGKEHFSTDRPVEIIVVDPGKPLPYLVEDIRKGLFGKINDLEVAVNIISGSGKEHMALISAILKLGLAIRYVYSENDKIAEL
jgi:hypothetical protein